MNRDHSISAIRGISMLCIVACHIMQYLNWELAWWFNVGVQIFLCISGFLYGRKEMTQWGPFFKKGFRKILVGYYIAFLPAAFVMYFIVKSASLGQVIRGLLCNGTIPGGGHLWFIPTILFCYCITVFLSMIFPKKDTEKKRIIKLGIVWILGFLVIDLFIPYFNPAWIFCYILGFYLGRIEDTCTYRRVSVLLCIGALLCNGVQILCDYVLHITLPMHNVFCNYSHVLLGAALFVILRNVFRNIQDCRLLRFSDRYSYEVYLVHQFFILGPLSLMSLTESRVLNLFLVFISIAVSAFAVKKITELVNRLAFSEKKG